MNTAIINSHNKTLIMKKLTLVLAVVAATLTSCWADYEVKLPNGAVQVARDVEGRDFKSGDTVCIYSDRLDWFIDSRGNMQDTVTMWEYTNSEGKERVIITIYKIGVIK